MIERVGIGTCRVFQGRNFMTPDLLGFYRVTTQAKRVLYVELAKGRGILGGTLYGVTVRRPDGSRLDPDPGTCYPTRALAMRAIERLERLT